MEFDQLRAAAQSVLQEAKTTAGIPRKVEIGSTFLDKDANEFKITKMWMEIGLRSIGTPWIEYRLTMSGAAGKRFTEKNSYEAFVKNYFK